MRSLVTEHRSLRSPESVLALFRDEPGVLLLRSGTLDRERGRFSYLVARPFLTFRAWGTRCEMRFRGRRIERFGNPWLMLEELLDRFELADELDHPFPLGGCFGFWGYDLKNHLEPRLPHHAVKDLELPDCHLGFYDSLVVFDHRLASTWIVSTGINPDGTRSILRAQRQLDFWKACLESAPATSLEEPVSVPTPPCPVQSWQSNFTREAYLDAVDRAREYIRMGHIYQVNLAQRLSLPCPFSAHDLHLRLLAVSPAPFAACLHAGFFQLASSSPELFLRISGRHIRTRPIKGTRPRSTDPVRDEELARELGTSPKELAELVMITDLLRNDLGRIAEFGSVQVPERVRLERYRHVQHLVATIEARLRPHVSHLQALAACFPGGSITGAPKIRAMEIIDELESVARGPYTGALGYVGFNQESQFNILIRTVIRRRRRAWFHAGAGIVADSDPESEYEETLAKARGFQAAFDPASEQTAIVRSFVPGASPTPALSPDPG